MTGSIVASSKKLLGEIVDGESLPFKEAFSNQHLENVFARYDLCFRDRMFPPDVAILAFCAQKISSDQSCRAAVNRVNSERLRLGLSEFAGSTSAYCQARNRLPSVLIKELALETGRFLEDACPNQWLWNGRHIKIMDGSTFSMPDTKANQSRWPQPRSQEEGLGFPIMRAVAIFSLATAAVLEMATGPCKGKRTGEVTLAHDLLSKLNRADILLCDRLFASYFFITKALKAGVDICTCLHGSRKKPDFRKGKRLSSGDHIIELEKPPHPKWMDQSTYDNIPTALALREIKSGFTDQDGEELVIATTLVDHEKYSKTEILAAHRMRWNCELDLRSLKSIMNMNVLSCKSPDMIEKEVWTYILAYNLIRQLICQSASRYEIEPRDISFTGALQAFNAIYPHLDPDQPALNQRMYDGLLRMIAQFRIGNRPNRSEPRAVKRRPKGYPLLMKPRPHKVRG